MPKIMTAKSFIGVGHYPFNISDPVEQSKLAVTDSQTSDCIMVSFFIRTYGTLQIGISTLCSAG